MVRCWMLNVGQPIQEEPGQREVLKTRQQRFNTEAALRHEFNMCFTLLLLDQMKQCNIWIICVRELKLTKKKKKYMLSVKQVC